jgi:hypothetical protein
MTTLPLNGVRLRVRLVEVEVSRLKLDPENPRLHSAYLTHDLPARPNEKQIAAVLEQLPEFQALLDAITRNDGVFQPPLVTADFRVLEGNRRVAALRKLQAADAKNTQWRTVTVHQLGVRIPAEQERALRAKFHLDYVEFRRISSVGTFDQKASPNFYLQLRELLRTPASAGAIGAPSQISIFRRLKPQRCFHS